MMIEIDDPKRRERELLRLGHIDSTVTVTVAGQTIYAQPEKDQERTAADGRTSTVHFLRFPLTEAHVAEFREPAAVIVLRIEHVHYAHTARLPEPVRSALAEDFA